MTKPPAYERIRRDVLAATRAVPSDFVTTYDAIGAPLDVMPRQVAHILETLSPNDRKTVPWHRVVGLDGRLSQTKPERSAEQQHRLANEGTVCDEIGRVQNFLDHLTSVIVLTHRRTNEQIDPTPDR
ncbi:MAG: MGMT family protein [Pseudomonadota bacterium]